MASLGFTLPTFAEGSQQLGSGDQGLNVYLFEYNATNGFIQASQGPRSLRVNVESANQVINISLCGWSYGANAAARDDLAIEVFQPSGTELTYTAAQVAATSPGSFSAAAAGGVGAWLLTEGNARTTAQPTLCANQVNPTQPATASTLSNPVRFIAPTAGTYEIRLYNDTEAADSLNNVFTYFDITVTPNATTNPDPRANNGQLWATAWAFNAGGNTFAATGGYDADLYIRTPGGRSGTEFLWQLDLNNFAPARHEIIANAIGLNAPNSRGSALGTSGAAYTKSFPIYLSSPNSSSTVAPILPEPLPPTLTNLRFIDNAGEDNTISPDATTGIQDRGFFNFDTDVAGTYKITIDTNKDGAFGTGDRILFGSATAGANAIEWDGKGVNNATLLAGTYSVQVSVGLGEYHFVTFDAETSGGGTNDGLSIWKSNGALRSPVLNYWDDTKITGGTSNLVGGLSDTAAGRHTWGDFTGAGIGNTNFVDTWVFGSPQTQETKAIIAISDGNDFGDAPDTYGTNKNTTVGGTPASHLINTNLILGANTPDVDTNGQPSVNADGDDINPTTLDDEDGVTSFNSLNVNATTYSVTVRVKNTVGAAASLGGWIDFNRDGQFQASEGVVQSIPNTTNGNVTLTWSGLSGLVAGDTYVRLRLNRDPLTTADFKGGGRDGEVEDYKLTIGGIPNVALVKRISSILRGTPGVEQIPASSYIDLTADINDNATGWPTLTATALKEPAGTPATTPNFSTWLGGIVTSTTVKPKDIVEYRINFLSNGTANAQNVALCDFIPKNSSYVAGSTQLVLGTTTTPISDTTTGTDTDGGFYPFTPLPSYPAACTETNYNKGAIYVNIGAVLQSTGSGAPTNSYGYIRFKTTVD